MKGQAGEQFFQDLNLATYKATPRDSLNYILMDNTIKLIAINARPNKEEQWNPSSYFRHLNNLKNFAEQLILKQLWSKTHLTTLHKIQKTTLHQIQKTIKNN